MGRRLMETAASIVKAQASVGKMSPEEIEHFLMNTFFVLQRMQDAENKGVLLGSALESTGRTGADKVASPTVAPKESIRENGIICLECGREMKQLTTKHLLTHGLAQPEYKKKWGLPMRTPLAAKSLSRARSRAAKKRGLPENLVKFLQGRKRTAAEGVSPSPPEGD